MWDIFKLKKAGIFAGGVLFGTAGVKILASDDAKKVYTNCTAAVLRAKECVMNTVTTVQENAGDIYEEAKNIMSHVQQKRLRLSTKQKKQKRQKLRKRIQVRRISKRKKFNSL